MHTLHKCLTLQCSNYKYLQKFTNHDRPLGKYRNHHLATSDFDKPNTFHAKLFSTPTTLT